MKSPHLPFTLPSEIKLKPVFAKLLLVVFLLFSCSRDDEPFDPENARIEKLMVGNWRLSAIREYENGEQLPEDEAIVSCLSRAIHVYHSDFTHDLKDSHHWIFGGKDGGGCVSINEGIESSYWEVVDNKTVQIHTQHSNGGSSFRSFDPEFISRDTFMIVTDNSTADKSVVKEVYFSRN